MSWLLVKPAGPSSVPPPRSWHSFSATANGQFVVTTAGPTPGGSVTFGYTATGVTRGTYTLAAQLTSPLLRTTSIAPVTVTVTR